MGEARGAPDPEFVRQQVASYAALRSRYQRYGTVLNDVLSRASAHYAPLAIVQARAKTIGSFAEKIMRKWGKRGLTDPVRQFTDLCGARVITTSRREVTLLSRFLEAHFEIDWENSVDASQHLQPTEFGYRSVHYIVSFKQGVFPTRKIAVEIPPEVFPDADTPMKAEVQVRTVLEHGWADVAHDLSYKSAFAIPQAWQREIARTAALLEDVDGSFERVHDGLRRYAATYGGYLSPEALDREIALLETVAEYDPDNAELATRLGKVAMVKGDLDLAIGAMSRLVASEHPPLLRDLGVALCKRHRGDVASAGYLEGRQLIQRAVELAPTDPDALASLAGTYKGIDEAKARELYRRAYEADPSDPYPLGNYVAREIAHQRSTAPAQMLAPAIRAAMQRCEDQAAVGMNMPWAFYNLGEFHLVLGEPYEALDAYTRAVRVSVTAGPIESARESVVTLQAAVSGALPGIEWARRLLTLAIATRTRDAGTKLAELPGLAQSGAPIQPPVVILAGGTSPEVRERMESYREVLRTAFEGFQGTIISGGTTAGVSGLAAEIGAGSRGAVRTIGYLPSGALPSDATIDERYGEIRRTDGIDFSPLEPLMNWYDLLASGIDPGAVKVLGIGGGRIAATEYRIALALGASVAVVEESGRAAARLRADEGWAPAENLVPCPPDPMTLRAFIAETGGRLPAGMRDTLARAVHEEYRSTRIAELRAETAEWEKLPEGLRESSAQQADAMFDKLRHIGCEVHEVKGRRPALMSFTPDEVELMAEMEHGRWVLERLRAGWRWGSSKDLTRKRSPYLVSWRDLPDHVKQWDRDAVLATPRILGEVGLEIRRTR